MREIVCALSKVAVVDPEVAKVLPDIRKAIDLDVANRLDAALHYFAREGERSTSSQQDVAAGVGAAG